MVHTCFSGRGALICHAQLRSAQRSQSLHITPPEHVTPKTGNHKRASQSHLTPINKIPGVRECALLPRGLAGMFSTIPTDADKMKRNKDSTLNAAARSTRRAMIQVLVDVAYRMY